MPEIAGQTYRVVVGTDLERDGMFVEIANSDGVNLAEVFYSDKDGRMTFTAWKQELPLEVVEWAAVYARERLTPVGDSSEARLGLPP
jgi:hypothetical protein